MEKAVNGVGPAASPGIPPIRWYSRSALDEFLAAAEREQARLEATIAGARQRLARANSAVGLHQTMIEMMLEVQREVAEIRRAAETQSGQIIASGELEADAILRGATTRSNGQAKAAGGGGAATVTVDAPPVVAPVGPVDSGVRPQTDDEAFFSYLRSELDKDEPLGPWQP
jgi:hypothetical protein